MRAVILLSPSIPDGAFATAEDDQFEIVGRRGGIVLVEFNSLPDGVTWFDTHELMYCQAQRDGDVVTVIRNATDEERAAFRVPLWIQGADVPRCCGIPMFFVGQIDDDQICMERPAGATLWWHDKASFYVFTCSQCLKCKAVGQQM